MRRLKTWVVFTLISIVLISIIIRLIKLYDFTLWGSDSGEHYFLLDQLRELGYIELDYTGWGFTYPYFPGMHILSTGFAESAGISTYHALVFVTPVVAALSVLLIFCISYRIFRDPRIGLVAAGTLAVALPHVYSSSHPMPGSLGGFLLLGCILLILKSYDNKKFIIPLGLTTIALVITHHLTIYFLIITVAAVIIFSELLHHPKLKKEIYLNRTRLNMGYLTFLITIALIYWLFYAAPFGDRILSKLFTNSERFIIPLAYLMICILWFLIYLRRRSNWHFQPRILSSKQLISRIVLFLAIGMSIILISILTIIPGTDIEIEPIAVVFFIPIILLISVIAAAPAFCLHYKSGIIVVAWLGVILMSILFSAATQSQELLLYRHFPYVFEPIAILTGVGVVKLFDMFMLAGKKDSGFVLDEPNSELFVSVNNSTKDTVFHSRPSFALRLCASCFVAILIIICGVLSYPPLEVLGGFEEGTTEDEFDSCLWARENLPDDSTVASDHRMSSMLFGFAGLNSTWEYAPTVLHGETFDEMSNELSSVRIPAGTKTIDYILITDNIKQGVTLKQWENAQPMSEPAVKKFDSSQFVKLYDNGDAQFYYWVDY